MGTVPCRLRWNTLRVGRQILLQFPRAVARLSSVRRRKPKGLTMSKPIAGTESCQVDGFRHRYRNPCTPQRARRARRA